MGTLFPERIPVLHFNSFPTAPVPGSDPSKYSALQKQLVASRNAFNTTGNGYFILHATKVRVCQSETQLIENGRALIAFYDRNCNRLVPSRIINTHR